MLFTGMGPRWRSWICIQFTAVALGAASPAVEAAVADTAAMDREPIILAQASGSRSGSSSSRSGSTGKSSSSSKRKTSSTSSKKPSTTARKTETRKEETPTSLTIETLPQALERIIQSTGRQPRWGVQIVHAETGRILFSHQENQHFIPASNRKIFTGALALDQLGPDYEFRTFLYHTGTVDSNGTLQGNLVILPQGDPTFSNRINGRVSSQHQTDWIYREWADKVKGAGIKHITGDILIDVSDWVWTDLQPSGWPNRILQDYYAVTPSPLTINENLMEIRLRPGAPGKPPVISFWPSAEGYPVKCTAVSGKEGSVQIVKPRTGPIQITGTVTKPITRALPCDNPTLFAAAIFRQRLRDSGITLGGTARIITRRGIVPSPTSESVIAWYKSPAMADMVKTMMKQSNNHYAEQLFVAVSAARTGRGGYTESRRLENELLKRAGIDVSNVQFGDGSGLSESNKVTPSQVTRLLAFMLQHPAAQVFVDSMAVGGVDGTLRGRMQTAALKGKVFAKTGFINGVSTLSGYYFKQPGQTFIFSFLVNNIPGGPGGAKAGQEQLLQALSRLEM